MAIIGWALHIRWLQGEWFNSRPLSPGSALCLAFLAVLLCRFPVQGQFRRAFVSILRVLALAVPLGVGLLIPMLHGLVWWLQTADDPDVVGPWMEAIASPWTPSLQFAICTLFLTLAIGLSSLRDRGSQLLGQGIALTLGVSVAFLLLGFLLDATHWIAGSIYPRVQLSPLILLSIVLLSAGLFERTHHVGAARLLTSTTAGGFAFRRLLPFVLVPIVSHWVFDGLAEHGLLASGVAFVSESIITGTVMVWLIVWISQLLHRRDQRHSQVQVERERRLVERERRRSCAAIEEGNERFLTVFNASPVGFLLADEKGRICLWNPPVNHIFGYTDYELSTMCVEDLIAAELRSEHRKLRESYQKDPTHRSMAANRELWGVTKLGNPVPVEVDLAPVQIDRRQYTLAAIVDISERHRNHLELRKYAEELEEANKALEGFTYAASHDLKAPMRAIDTLTKCLKEELEGTLSPSSAEHLDNLQSRVGRMERLLDDLLAYSQQRDSQHAIESARVEEIVEAVFDAVRPPDSFTLHWEADLETLQTARVPLELCLRNLIDNAIKHHDKSDGTVRLEFSAQGERVRISVSDDGPGIPLESRRKVFEPFQTLTPRASAHTSGIGLTLTRNIVNRFGGIIRIEGQEPQRGTRFVFDWPMTLEAATTASQRDGE